MNLGERIYQLRTGKNMSQGDLADKLNVSRQSISKWENNSAVPDLDKIVKLSEIFGVSMDVLVKGEEIVQQAEKNPGGDAGDTSNPQVIVVKQAAQTGTIVGILLICLSIVTVFIAPGMIFFVVPLILCGIVCVACKKHVGVKCAWVIYLYADIVARYTTGINWSVIKLTFSWTPEMNYGRLCFGWVLFLARVILAVVTIMILRKDGARSQVQTRNRALIQWGVVLAITVLMAIGSEGYHSLVMSYIMSYARVLFFVNSVLDCCRFGFFTAALLNTVRYIFGGVKANR